MDTKLIKDILKKYKLFLIIWIFVIGFGIGLASMGYIEANKEVKFTYLNDLIVKNDKNTYKNAYLEVHTSPFVFAEYEKEDSRFYIVKDSEYLYIVYLNEDIYNKLANIEDLETTPFRIEGYTETISSDIKELAIEAYNEAFEEDIINEDNFDSYFGTIYLNTNGLHDNSYILYLLAALIAVIGLAGIFGIAIKNKKLKKVILSDEKKISKELDSKDVFKSNKVILTKSYLITLENSINIIKNKDIVWFYKENTKTLGIKTSQSLIVVTKDREKHTVSKLLNTRNNEIKFGDIYNNVAKRLPKALESYTEENIKKAEKMYEK